MDVIIKDGIAALAVIGVLVSISLVWELLKQSKNLYAKIIVGVGNAILALVSLCLFGLFSFAILKFAVIPLLWKHPLPAGITAVAIVAVAAVIWRIVKSDNEDERLQEEEGANIYAARSNILTTGRIGMTPTTDLEAARFWMRQTEWSVNRARTARNPTRARDMLTTAHEFAGYSEEAAVADGGEEAREYADKAKTCWNNAKRTLTARN